MPETAQMYVSMINPYLLASTVDPLTVNTFFFHYIEPINQELL